MRRHFNQGQIDNVHAVSSVAADWTGLYEETKDRTEPGVQSGSLKTDNK